MRCPVCKSHEQSVAALRSGAFAVKVIECRSCGSVWSLKRGEIGLLKDAQENSFLETVTECVEGADYHLVA